MNTMTKLMLGLGLIFLSSCSKTMTFPLVGKVTTIEVVGPPASTFPFKSKVKKIINGSRVSKIVSFVDGHQSGWSSPDYHTMPAAGTTLVFYNGKTERRVFGIGTNFFSAHGKGDWVLKNVSQQEKQKLFGLIGSKN